MSIGIGSLLGNAIDYLSTECERHSFLGPFVQTIRDWYHYQCQHLQKKKIKIGIIQAIKFK